MLALEIFLWILTGQGLYITASFLNHSSNRNCEETYDGKTFLLRALRPIKKGQECTVTYRDVILLFSYLFCATLSSFLPSHLWTFILRDFIDSSKNCITSLLQWHWDIVWACVKIVKDFLPNDQTQSSCKSEVLSQVSSYSICVASWTGTLCKSGETLNNWIDLQYCADVRDKIWDACKIAPAILFWLLLS